MVSCSGGESFCSSSGLAVMEDYLPSCTSAEHKAAVFSQSEGTKQLSFLFEIEIKSPANSNELALDLGALSTEKVIGEGWMGSSCAWSDTPHLFSQQTQGLCPGSARGLHREGVLTPPVFAQVMVQMVCVRVVQRLGRREFVWGWSATCTASLALSWTTMLGEVLVLERSNLISLQLWNSLYLQGTGEEKWEEGFSLRCWVFHLLTTTSWWVGAGIQPRT